jgi:hypothetical protein
MLGTIPTQAVDKLIGDFDERADRGCVPGNGKVVSGPAGSHGWMDHTC